MPIRNILAALAACTVVLVGCASKEEPAKQVVAGAEATLAPLREDATVYAAEQLQDAESKLAKAKENITWEKYQDVLDQAPALNASIIAVKENVISKKTQVAAATHEWESLSTEVPQIVDAIDRQISNLPKAKRDAAKADVDSLKAVWTEATTAFSNGDVAQAADKAREAQAKGKEVMEQLGMTPI